MKPKGSFPGKKKSIFTPWKMLMLSLCLLLLPAVSSFGKSSVDSLLTVVKAAKGYPMIASLSASAYERRNDNPQEAIQLSLEALEMSRKEKLVDGLIFNYRLLGNLYVQTYQYEEAIDSYNQCLAYSIPRNDSVTIRECYNNQGAIFFTKGLNSKALDNFLLGLKYSENLDKEREYNNIGAVFFNEREYDEAYNYYHKALEIFKQKGNQYGIMATNNNIGDVFKMMQKYDVALMYYKKVLSASDSSRNFELDIISTNNIGVVKEMMGDSDSAFYYYKIGLEKAELLGDQPIITRTLGLVGKVLYDKGLYAKAKEYLERSYNMAKDLVIYEDMSSTAELLQLIYEKDGNYKEAYRYSNIQKLASDSISAYKAKEQVLQLMFDHQVRLQELEKKQLLEAEQHERKKSVFVFYLIILVLIIIVLIGVLFLLRTIQLRKIDQIKKEKAFLQVISVEKDIELRNREIIEKVLKISEKNELIDATFKQLDAFAPSLSQKQRAQLEMITRDLRTKGTKNQWEEFFWYFSQIYSQFYEKLEKEFPNLTLNEKRLCALLKLNMTTKDMAAITNLNFKSIEVARTRLRKKLNLTNSNLTLQEFFSQFN